MKIAGSFLLLLIAVSGFMVVRTRDVTSQTLALSFYGLLLAVMFFFFQAPDVALSQIVVGAVALPLIIKLAIARIKHKEKSKGSEGGQ
jgi:uncharacterized MnhB-related membrane protein